MIKQRPYLLLNCLAHPSAEACRSERSRGYRLIWRFRLTQMGSRSF
jgi:hypothetical protein